MFKSVMFFDRNIVSVLVMVEVCKQPKTNSLSKDSTVDDVTCLYFLIQSIHSLSPGEGV